jgi:hypothetical protein
LCYPHLEYICHLYCYFTSIITIILHLNMYTVCFR